MRKKLAIITCLLVVVVTAALLWPTATPAAVFVQSSRSSQHPTNSSAPSIVLAHAPIPMPNGHTRPIVDVEFIVTTQVQIEVDESGLKFFHFVRDSKNSAW